ncbi:MAG: mannose-1-phosphate guanylyltransferase [Lachnospiraceae bacterium]|jgi:mannose-1-phosphate guanylyltransferase|nr:mannose-1-phosphate guanylyltransferase [Lachnospiraceae bacterium]
MNRYGVVMAGGGGTRFWPLSRQELPKQFLNLTGDDLMVNETIARLKPSLKSENLFIVTNVTQSGLMRQATEGVVLSDHILSEPASRNTAACIGYAAVEILKKYGDGIMGVFASDHYIRDVKGFNDTLRQAIQLAEETDNLITIGIRPTFPAVGYGYIKYDKTETDKDYHKVKEFVEKPDVMTARSYLKGGGFLWNSGMFVWRVSTILKYFERLLPDVYACLMEIEASLGTPQEQEVIDRVYPTIPKISIDYGIMERAKEVTVVESKFDWSDVGSWDALEALHEKDENGNVANREQILIDTQNCVVYAKSKLIATLGVEDLIIVEAEDAIMVCHKDKAQSVREIPDELKKQGKVEYL